MGYSDGKFYLDVLHGYAYRYWWEGLTRNGPGCGHRIWLVPWDAELKRLRINGKGVALLYSGKESPMRNVKEHCGSSGSWA